LAIVSNNLVLKKPCSQATVFSSSLAIRVPGRRREILQTIWHRPVTRKNCGGAIPYKGTEYVKIAVLVTLREAAAGALEG
jgi:hypothetical protein